MDNNNDLIKTNETTILFVINKDIDNSTSLDGLTFKHFKGIELVEVDYEAIKKRIEELEEEQQFVIFFHLKADSFIKKDIKWVNRLSTLVDEIQREFPRLRINYNTSVRTDEIIKIIKEHMSNFDEHSLFQNATITRNVELGKIKTQTKKQISTSGPTSDPNPKPEGVSIFLSHSSKDKAIMDDFKQMLIESGLQIPLKNIFYSSESGSGVAISENGPVALYNAIKDTTLFIRYVSENYNKSHVCHNEFGAAWYKNQNDPKKVITLKAKDLPIEEVGYLNNQRQFVKIEDSDDWTAFRDQYIHKYFPDSNGNRWKKELEQFLQKWFPKS